MCRTVFSGVAGKGTTFQKPWCLCISAGLFGFYPQPLPPINGFGVVPLNLKILLKYKGESTMLYLVLGLVVFLGMHSLRIGGDARRDALRARLGEGRFKAA